MYAIFRDCRLKVVGEVRRVNLPSPIDLTCHPYNIGHTTVRPCDLILGLLFDANSKTREN